MISPVKNKIPFLLKVETSIFHHHLRYAQLRSITGLSSLDRICWTSNRSLHWRTYLKVLHIFLNTTLTIHPLNSRVSRAENSHSAPQLQIIGYSQLQYITRRHNYASFLVEMSI